MTDPDYPQTSIFAHEIEQALCAAAFAAPWRIEEIYRAINPLTALTRPECRHILEAISLVYYECHSTDFAHLVIALRELGYLEACGGTDGVNAILSQYQYGFSSKEAESEIIGHYLELLSAYDKARTDQPAVMPYRFNRGDFTLYANKTKHAESAPDWIGNGKVVGRSYHANAYRGKDSVGQRILFISIHPLFAILILLTLASSVIASPFLVCDPYPAGLDQSTMPVSFILAGLTAQPISVPVQTNQDGTIQLHYDLSQQPHGTFTVTAAAVNVFGGSSLPSVPFVFTSGVPAVPSNLRIVP